MHLPAIELVPNQTFVSFVFDTFLDVILHDPVLTIRLDYSWHGGG